MSNVAVRIENLSKIYRIGGQQERYRTLRDSITDTVSAPFKRARSLLRGQAYGAAGLEEVIWALKNVSFEVKHGEVIGIIGRNGAGKSTLLKVLSRITDPTEGYVDLYGRVGALLEVGTGFHLELTGRENIYLNGAILGMSREEIDRKFDEMVDFAGVERFIDTPVKHYSSGMGLRLGFAVAAHLEPEILIVDEVLAVGDAAFQRKCLGKMGQVASEGRTVLFVSHNMVAVENLCSRAILLEGGQMVQSGPTSDIIHSYIDQTDFQTQIPLENRTDQTGDGSVRLTRLAFYDTAMQELSTVMPGDDFQIAVDYEAQTKQEVKNISIGITVATLQGDNLFCLWDQVSGSDFPSHLPAQGRLVCQVKNLSLLPGSYSLHLAVTTSKRLAYKLQNAARLEVVDGDFFGTGQLPPSNLGKFLVPHKWQFQEKDNANDRN